MSDVQLKASPTCDALSGMRNDDAFQKFWEEVQNKLEEADIGAPVYRKDAKHPNDPSWRGEGYATTPEQHYRAIYFEAFDIIVAYIKDRFNQPGYACSVTWKIACQCCHWEMFWRWIWSCYGIDF